MASSKMHTLASNVGISGFKHIVGSDVSLGRRFAWVLVILSATAWMLWNIHDRVTYFFEYPSAITTEVKFSDKLLFPKITICNQNVFRSSIIFEESSFPRKSPTLYEAIDRYYQVLLDQHGKDNKTCTKDVINKYGHLLANSDVESFYLKAAHKKEKLIEKCTWKGKICGAENFSTVMTDLGVCYQFHTTQHDDLLVDTAGQQGGLHLTLNAEQYDYMRGPRNTAGVMVVITDWNETHASAQELGVGVSVGSTTSIVLLEAKVRDLPAPHGVCGSKGLHYFPSITAYSPLKCRSDCLTSYLKEKCNCVLLHMAHNSSVPVCTFLQNLQCVKPNADIFYSSGLAGECDCPSSCTTTRYDKYISQTRISERALKDTAVSGIGASTTDINKASYIQDWGMLNKYDPNLTDKISGLAEHLVTLNGATENLSSVTQDYQADFFFLFESMQEHGIQDLVENKTMEQTRDKNIPEWYSHNPGYPSERTPFITAGPEAMKNLIIFTNRMLNKTSESLHLNGGLNGALEAILAENVVSNRDDINELSEFLFMDLRLIDKSLYIILNYSSVIKHELEVLQVLNANITRQLDVNRDRLISRKNNVRENRQKLMDQWTDITKPTLNKMLLRVKEIARDSLFPDFYRENQLHLEIYFKELSIHESRKSSAYAAEGLICDIGGSIGLCLGGSILTFIEIFDIFILSWFQTKETKSDLEKEGNEKKEENEMEEESVAHIA